MSRRYLPNIALIAALLIVQGLFFTNPAQAAPRAIFTWSMEPRYQDSWAAWNSDPAHYTSSWVNPKSWPVNSYNPDYVHPKSWKVHMDACQSTGQGSAVTDYVWHLEGVGFNYEATATGHPTTNSQQCKQDFDLPQQGVYSTMLTILTADRQSISSTVQVAIRDWLIVSIGDSFSSGEGNPDQPGLYDIKEHKLFGLTSAEPDVTKERRAAVWQDRRCHRSALSGPALAAEKLENADPHTSVTFISFACSGAEIKHLITDCYDGEEPPTPENPNIHDHRICNGIPRQQVVLQPQIDAVQAAVASRQIDALLMTAGINDMDFSGIVKKCAENTQYKLPIDDPTCVGAYPQFLTERYNALGTAIAKRLNPVEVFVADYPNNVLVGGGCDELWTVGPKEGAAIQDLGEFLLSPAIYMAAQKFGWNIVLGANGNSTITDAFAHHAYCDKPRWFVGVNESARTQGPKTGALHPTRDGHNKFGAMLAQAIKLGQPPDPYARVVLTVTAIRLRGGDRRVTIDVRGNNFLAMTPQSCSFVAPPTSEYFSDADTDGTNIARPLSKGCTFTLNVWTAPTLQRHATHVDIVARTVQNFVEASYDQNEGYGSGSHEIVSRKVNNIDIAVKYTIDVERINTQPTVCCRYPVLP